MLNFNKNSILSINILQRQPKKMADDFITLSLYSVQSERDQFSGALM